MLPPLTGVAVKVTDVPGVIVVALATIETEGVTIGFTMTCAVLTAVAAPQALLAVK